MLTDNRNNVGEKMSNTFGLVCYTISDSESDQEEDEEEEEITSESVVSHVIEHILRDVCHGLRDFSDMYIKQEPEDSEEWEAAQDYRDSHSGATVKIESDDSDSESSSEEESSEEEMLAATTRKKPNMDMAAEPEGRIYFPSILATYINI